MARLAGHAGPAADVSTEALAASGTDASMAALGGAIVGRLRIVAQTTAAGDPRIPAARRVEGLDLRPPSLPPSSILCVRRLADPGPRRLRLDGHENAATRAWRELVVDVLDDLVGSAARPADGPVPANAEAVVFRDEVELLACLARDWSQLGGRLNWWWRELVPAKSDDAVSERWLASPQLVPAVIDRLERSGSLARTIATLTRAEALALFDTMWRAHGMAHRSTARRVGSGDPRRPRVAATPSHFGGGAGAAQATPRAEASRSSVTLQRAFGSPPRGISPSMPGLSGAHRALVVAALALHRAPIVARAEWFSRALAEATPRGSHADTRTSPTERAPTANRVTRRSARGARARHPGDHGSTLATHEATADAASRAAAPRRRDAPSRPATRDAETHPSVASAADVVDTELGGLFYLLDLALYLGLYGDFTTPAQPGIGLDPWDFVTLLGEHLGAAAGADDDAVWPLLAALANRRTGVRPGAGWLPPAEWRVPTHWLAPFPDSPLPWRWSIARGRLRVDHPASFRVIDVAHGGRGTRATALRALRSYGVRPTLLRVAPVRPPPRGRRPIDRWIALVGEYARARLNLALETDPGDERELATVLFRHHARVYVAADAIEVAMSLGSLPLAIRICGLDRDPGWIPAARRTVRFHFA